jgi:hypothetical protein
VVILDESHHFRNRDGRRWAVVRDYISRNASKCVLLSATPYNKQYLDLANQLRLFLEPEEIVGVRPEEYLRRDCDGRVEEFTRRHQCPVNCLAAFEKSGHADDWREMMRRFMVRRTRGFVERNYALTECPACARVLLAVEQKCPQCGRAKAREDRRFLVLEGGGRFHFPARRAKTLSFRIRDHDPEDQYARLYSDRVVDTIRLLHLPRYGLANYLKPTPDSPPTTDEAEVMKNLSRAGKRLIGFCRTNLFKRLESSGHAFLLSVRRHITRNFIFLHALENGLPLPIGTQDAAFLDTRADDNAEEPQPSEGLFEGGEVGQDLPAGPSASSSIPASLAIFRAEAAAGYQRLRAEHGNNFDWLRHDVFTDELAQHLRRDAELLFSILELAGEWRPEKDHKLAELLKLVAKKHPGQKALVFSQFADTVIYLTGQLRGRGLKQLAGVTGETEDSAAFARRFSPESNKAREHVSPSDEIRVLVATDVLSEGQNLQDAAIVVNFDLPWAIIRLIQRAGRVDRIGQKAEEILCYSFLPAEGVERLIRLRSRVRQRLQENAEVVGTDETFFEDERHDEVIRDLFTEKSGCLDDVADDEVDLASLAYQIWKNASDADENLKKTIPDLANVSFSTKALSAVPAKLAGAPGPAPAPGVMVYVRTADGNDALAWLDEAGRTVTESQHEILRAAACEPATPALPRLSNHHPLVQQAVAGIQTEQSTTGGQLGKPSSARRRVYERLKDHAARVKNTLFDIKPLHQAVDAIYDAPLTEAARDLLNRELRAGITDEKLVDLVLALHEEDRLCLRMEEADAREPKIICSLGIAPDSANS